MLKWMLATLLSGAMFAMSACGESAAPPAAQQPATPTTSSASAAPAAPAMQKDAPAQNAAKATFAGGCFWCTEEAFEKVPGVIEAVSGYMGGTVKNPSYQQVSSGRTGHTEVVEVRFDPAKVSYEKLLDVFWVNHDPTVLDRQFCDDGSQYRPEIFVHDDEQKRLAEASKAKWQKAKPFKQNILTPITPASDFWPAEDYHQDYYKKNPFKYKGYVTGCGRYDWLDQLWGDLRRK